MAACFLHFRQSPDSRPTTMQINLLVLFWSDLFTLLNIIIIRLNANKVYNMCNAYVEKQNVWKILDLHCTFWFVIWEFGLAESHMKGTRSLLKGARIPRPTWMKVGSHVKRWRESRSHSRDLVINPFINPFVFHAWLIPCLHASNLDYNLIHVFCTFFYTWTQASWNLYFRCSHIYSMEIQVLTGM